MIRRAILSLFAAASLALGAGAKVNYVPDLEGVIRGRWEIETRGGWNRFAVRNARLSVAGKVAEPVSYYLRADFCDMGKFKFLDGWVQLRPFRPFNIRVGQFRMPCGVETFRGPTSYIFANRSFIGGTLCNYRAVGARLAYTLPFHNLTLEGGVFNPGTISDHTPWTRGKAYAAKATATIGDFKVSGSILSNIPDGVRMNFYDVALVYDCGRWHAEAEYMHQAYTGSAFKACNSVNTFVDYGIPVDLGIFETLSFQGRFDWMTDQSNGRCDDSGRLQCTSPAKRRITLGSTISYNEGPLFCDIRLNYEKYFYNDGVAIPEGKNDKIVAELIIRF